MDDYPLYYAFEGASPPSRTGASHATIYPYGPFPAGDGRTIMLGLQNEREWAVFSKTVLQRPELATDARFSTNSKRSAARKELRAIIIDAFAGLTVKQVVERLDEAQIANAQVNDMHAVWAHPQLKARKRWREVNTPAGHVPALLPPGSWEEGDPRMEAVPALGEHTAAILGELGYSNEKTWRIYGKPGRYDIREHWRVESPVDLSVGARQPARSLRQGARLARRCRHRGSRGCRRCCR